MRVGVLAALLWLGLAGSALAGPCGDAVSDALCMAQDALFGPNGVVPFTMRTANQAGGIILELLPILVGPLGAWS